MAGYMSDAPDETSPTAFLGRVPDDEPFPAAWHGKPFVAVAGMYVGDVAAGHRALQPLRELGEPIADLSRRLPYVDVQKLLDEEYPKGRRYHWKSIDLDGLGAEAIERLVTLAEGAPSSLSTIDISFQGGAMARVAPEATAFGDRSASILIGVEANWDESAADEANIAWARGCIDGLRPFSEGGTYLNFLGFLQERDQQLRAAYGANHDRLVQ